MKEIENLKTVIVNPLLKLLLAAAVIYFLWGVAQFVLNRNEETKAGEGRQHMLYGVIGLAVILGVFGIVNVIVDFLKNFK